MPAEPPENAPKTTTETATPEASGRAGAPHAWRVRSPERYRIIAEHARGGIGRVLRAVDVELGRTVALKELIRDDAVSRERFIREATITCQLEHPGIVPVYDAGVWPNGELFYEMKFIDGSSLRDLLRESAGVRERLSYLSGFVSVADAMAYAHDRGIVHRDLKPSNIVVGGFGEVMIVDWGLAKSIDETADETRDTSTSIAGDVTIDGAVVGTPAYMAPEQARGGTVDQRSDVFALGAILYELLSGSPPFDADSFERRRRGDAVSPRSPLDTDPGVPKDLAAIALRALSPEPSDRYRDAGDLAREVRRFQDGQLVRARRYTPLELATRWLWRKRAWVGAVAVAAGFATALTAARRHQAVEPLCKNAQKRIAATWNPSTESAWRDSMLASGSPLAQPTVELLQPRLSSYADSWLREHASACADTYEGDQPAGDLALRLRCLQQAHIDFGAYVAEYSDSTKASAVVNAPKNFGTIPSPSSCRDPKSLRAWPARPPMSPERETQFQALQARLAEARLLIQLPDLERATARIASLRKDAEQFGDRALIAEVAFEEAMLLEVSGDFDGAIAGYRRALESAGQAKHDPVAGWAWDRLFHAVYLQGDAVRAAELGKLAKAAALRPEIPRLAASYWDHVGIVSSGLGEYDAARESMRKAMKIRQSQLNPSHPDQLKSLINLGFINMQLGDLDEAASLQGKALTTITESLGPAHPLLAVAHQNLGAIAGIQGASSKAAEHFSESVRIREFALGPDHPDVKGALTDLATVLMDSRDHAGAGKILERSCGTSPALDATLSTIDVACLNARSRYLVETGEWQRAKGLLEAILASAPKSAIDTYAYAETNLRYGDTLLMSNNAGAAFHRFEIARTGAGEDTALRGSALAGMSEASLRLGKTKEAATYARDSLDQLPEGISYVARQRARAHLSLSQTLAPRDPARKQHAEAARTLLDASAGESPLTTYWRDVLRRELGLQ